MRLSIAALSLAATATATNLRPRQLLPPLITGTTTTCGPYSLPEECACTTCTVTESETNCDNPIALQCSDLEDWIRENRRPGVTFVYQTREGGERTEYNCEACEEGKSLYTCTKCGVWPSHHCVLPAPYPCEEEEKGAGEDGDGEG